MTENEILELRKSIFKYGKFLGEKNMSPATSGNISVRCDENVLITATESCLYDLEDDEIVQINMDAERIGEGKKPSSEKNMHCAIYKKRPDINAIIHCHAPYTSVFAVCDISLDSKSSYLPENVFYFGEIPVAPYALPGSDLLAATVSEYFDKHDAVLLANHGIIIGAKDLKTAYYLTETAESIAKIYINSCILAGGIVIEPKKLSSKDIDDLEKLRNMVKI